MALCRVHNATPVIAKLDRLSRDAHFLLGLQKAGVRFVAADMPEANEMVVGKMAVVAQAERKMISTRTKAALAAAKARGVKLGGDRRNLNPEVAHKSREASRAARQDKAKARAGDLAPVPAQLRQEGITSLRAVSTALNKRGIPTTRGGQWSPVQVSRLLAYLGGGQEA